MLWSILIMLLRPFTPYAAASFSGSFNANSGYRICLMSLERKETLYGRSLPDKETARKGLMRLTGQDSGYDAEQWRKWIKENRKGLHKKKIGGFDLLRLCPP